MKTMHVGLLLVSVTGGWGACDSTNQTDLDSESDTGGERETDSGSSTDSDGLRGPCPAADNLGGLEISVASEFSSISGAFNDGVVPASVQTLELEEGACALWRRSNPTCDPACPSGQTCDFDGTCIPYPTQQDAGVITLDGLSAPVSLEPLPPGNSYFDSTIAHPAFSPGDDIRMTTTDGYFGVIEMHGVGVAPMVDTALSWTLVSGEPLVATWTAPEEDVGSRMMLHLNIDQHGSSPLTLVCDFDDTGEGEVSASLVDGLLNGGVSGMANGRLTRRTVDSVAVDGGCIELLATSSQRVDVSQGE